MYLNTVKVLKQACAVELAKANPARLAIAETNNQFSIHKAIFLFVGNSSLDDINLHGPSPPFTHSATYYPTL